MAVFSGVSSTTVPQMLRPPQTSYLPVGSWSRATQGFSAPCYPVMLLAASFARFLLGPARDGRSEANMSSPMTLVLSGSNWGTSRYSAPLARPSGGGGDCEESRRMGTVERQSARRTHPPCLTSSTEGQGPAGSGQVLKMSDVGSVCAVGTGGEWGRRTSASCLREAQITQHLTGPGA